MDWQTQLTAGIATLTLGTIVTLVTVFKGVLQAWGNRLIRRIEMTEKKYVSGFDQVASFDAIFLRLRDLKFVDRVMLLRGDNCGGIPSAGKPYKVRSTFGSSSILGLHPEDMYKTPFAVDPPYIAMLCEMLTAGMVVMTRETMPKGSVLRDFYDEEGVFQSLVFYLQIDKEDSSLRFFSVANYTRAFTSSETSQIRLLANRIRAVMTTGTDPGTSLQVPILPRNR